MPKARRVESAKEVGSSSAIENTTMHHALMQETQMEPQIPETPIQDANRDSGVLGDRREPPSPDYIRGTVEVHGDVHPMDAEFNLPPPTPHPPPPTPPLRTSTSPPRTRVTSAFM
jgi:hypothetical protein